MEISVDQLFNMIQAEKKTGEVIPLPRDFYRNAIQKLSKLEQIQEDQQHSGNFKKLLSQVRERRVQKLLIYLAYNKQLPSLVPEEEEELYRGIKALLDKKEAGVTKVRKIRIIAETPELVMPNGGKSGPYKEHQVIETTDNYEAEFLLNNKLGEQI
ncbi:MAG: hypothetical protein KGH65_00280 [Candidatus Micrarchaeota archaeon]|nr:hypothetical protein [Candidatus Micrarchaeota archaeon]